MNLLRALFARLVAFFVRPRLETPAEIVRNYEARPVLTSHTWVPDKAAHSRGFTRNRFEFFCATCGALGVASSESTEWPPGPTRFGGLHPAAVTKVGPCRPFIEDATAHPYRGLAS